MKSIAVALAVMFMSCYAAPKMTRFDNRRVIDAPFERVWPSLIEVLTNMQAPIETIEKESGMVRVSRVDVPKNYCHCGSGLMVLITRSVAAFNVFVRDNGDSTTTMTVNAQFEGWNENGLSKTWISCNSTGKLEDQILLDVLLTATSTRRWNAP